MIIYELLNFFFFFELFEQCLQLLAVLFLVIRTVYTLWSVHAATTLRHHPLIRAANQSLKPLTLSLVKHIGHNNAGRTEGDGTRLSSMQWT